jgi:hypothetical protein
MRRDFKFRAWDKDVKKMYYRDFCIIPTTPSWGAVEYWGVQSSHHDMEDLSIFDWGNARLLMGTKVIMQWVGLRDKNGKDIYEGDIIVFDQTDIGGEKIEAEVDWIDDLTLAPMPGFGLWVSGGRGFRPLDIGGYEVLGNIYENKRA